MNHTITVYTTATCVTFYISLSLLLCMHIFFCINSSQEKSKLHTLSNKKFFKWNFMWNNFSSWRWHTNTRLKRTNLFFLNTSSPFLPCFSTSLYSRLSCNYNFCLHHYAASAANFTLHFNEMPSQNRSIISQSSSQYIYKLNYCFFDADNGSIIWADWC